MRVNLTASLAAVMLLVCAVTLTPIWAINDDVALAMLGSGFGIADAPTSQLIFAHPIYGLALNALAPILGTAAHGWLTIAALVLATATLGLALAPMRFGTATLATCWLALLVPATLTPIFTVTAGVLFAAGAAWYLAEAEGPSGRAMAIGVLAFGYILRPECFYLGMLVLAPIIALQRPWRPGRARELMLTCLLIGVVGYASDWIWLRMQPGWQAALNANRLRAMFTDFHQVPWIDRNPAYQAAGWTKLDYDVFMSWYPYHGIFAPDRLAGLIQAVGRPPLSPPPDAWVSWFAIPWGWTTLTFAAATVIVLGLAISPWWSALAWAVGPVACLCILGASGRPPLDRVWFAILGIAGFAAAALALKGDRTRSRWLILLALPLAVMVAVQAVSAHATLSANARSYRRWLSEHPFPAGQPVVVWADALRYEWAVPVLASHNPFPRAGILGIGALADSPVQREVRTRLGITDVSAWLCRGPGTTLLARSRQVSLLTRFCEERMGGAPSIRSLAHYGDMDIYELAPAKKP